MIPYRLYVELNDKALWCNTVNGFGATEDELIKLIQYLYQGPPSKFLVCRGVASNDIENQIVCVNIQHVISIELVRR